MAAPVADGLVGGVLQGGIARGDGHYLCAQHLHLLHVDVLALNVGFSHKHEAFHTSQGTDSSGCHVVDLVSAGVVQVFPLQIDLAAVFLGQAAGMVER